LSEREPSESISHRSLPSMEEHLAFVQSMPYRGWYVARIEDVEVGAVYLTKNREIGVGILKEHRRRGYGSEAVQLLMNWYAGGEPYFANVNPNNKKSMRLFESLGFAPFQVTLRHE
jgi:RimJ/RimL family protein N-acetyltransferase